eukprot:Skav216810  [mRNA]  locus=scaffold135:54537:60375:- [translate_table: standard]
MDFRCCDPFGFLDPDPIAFTEGVRLKLRCTDKRHDCLVGSPVMVDSAKPFHCSIPNWASTHINIGDEFLVLQFEATMMDDFWNIKAKQGILLPIRLLGDHADAPAVECYAGIGGWSHAAQLAGLSTDLMIERDQITAEACSRSHRIPALSTSDALFRLQQGELPSQFVLIEDVNSVAALFFIGRMGCATWMKSPPCQPWSRAGSAQGVNTDEGRCFFTTIINAAAMKVKVLLMENVPGFPQHQHHAYFRQLCEKMQFQCVFASQESIAPLCPIFRTRWLALFVAKSVQLNETKCRIARSFEIPKNLPGIGRETSLGKAECFQSFPQKWEVERATPDPEALMMMSSPVLLPDNMKSMISAKASPQEVLALRTKSARNMLPSVMAMYGSQHLLPERHLREKGLHSFVLNTDQGLRYALPYEIAMAMGFPQTTVLPCDFVKAWQITGNSLAVPHAALLCLKAHIALDELSPFQTMWNSVRDMCQDFLATRVSMDDYVIEHHGHWMWMKLRLAVTIPVSPTTEVDEDHIPIDDLPCFGTISPTWRVEDESDIEPCSPIPKPCKDLFPDLPMEGVATCEVTKASLLIEPPSVLPNGLNEKFNNGQIIHREGAASVTLLHSKGFWATHVWRQEHETVQAVFRKALPHAKANHFQELQLGDRRITFHTQPTGTGNCEILFEPHVFLRIAQARFADQDVSIFVDVTWTFHDFLAYAATEFAVMPSFLTASVNHTIIQPDQFVLAFPDVAFQIEFRSVFLPMDRLAYKDQDADILSLYEPISKDENMKRIKKTAGPVQFAAWEPKWGTVRVATVDQTDTVGALLDALFPSMKGDSKPQIVANTSVFKEDHAIFLLTNYAELSIHFPGNQWPNAMMVKSCNNFAKSALNEKVMVNIRGPFDAKPHLKSFAANMSMMEVGLKCFENCHRTMSFYPVVAGKTCDPRLPIMDIPSMSFVEIRACALPGGTKIELNKQLATVLEKRGVPSELSGDRAKLILSKIQAAELRTVLSKEESQMWSELKNLANQAKVRLITSEELKKHQKQTRGSKAGKTAKQPNPKKQAQAKNIQVDLSHFKAGGHRLLPIDMAAFGPDSRGICFTTYEAAKAFIPVTRLSADPLALLILSTDSIANVEPIVVPAVDQFQKPVVTSVVVLNYGDVPVVCTPDIPSASVDEAIRPSGPHTWLVCSHEEPPASHLLLNNQYVAVVAVGVANKPKQTDVTMSKQPVNANFAMCPDEADAVSDASASTRFDEIKSNLEEHIAGLVHDKLKQYDQQIEVLKTAIDQTRNESQAATTELKSEITTVAQQQNAIQEQIVQGNTGVVNQMQKMFQQMQSSINTRWNNGGITISHEEIRRALTRRFRAFA